MGNLMKQIYVYVFATRTTFSLDRNGARSCNISRSLRTVCKICIAPY